MKENLMLVVAILALLSGPVAAQYAGDPEGAVKELTGDVTLTQKGVRSVAVIDAKMFPRDTLSTAEKALARVLVKMRYTVTVRELSVFALGDEEVQLIKGALRVQYHNPFGKPLPVRGPQALAAVRGSDAVFEVVGMTFIITGISGQIEVCREIVEQYDQIVINPDCTSSRRRMAITEWAQYIAWSEKSTAGATDLSWKSLYLYSPETKFIQQESHIQPNPSSVNPLPTTVTQPTQSQGGGIIHQSPQVLH
jgi:hypothetical protein